MNLNQRWNYIGINSQGEMLIENIPVSELVKQYDSPLYIISENKINENFIQFKKAFSDYPKVCIQYACKCNSNMKVIEILKEAGAGLDASSPGEIILGLALDISPDKISYTSGLKGPKEIAYALKKNIRYITIDCFEDIYLIDKTASEMNLKANVVLRVNPEIKTENYSTMENKFGIKFSEASEAINLILKSNNLNLKGFHFHGGYIHENQIYYLALKKLIELVKIVKENGVEIEDIDIGGGYPYPNMENSQEFNLEILGKEISNYLIEQFKLLNYRELPTLILEPGKFLVANAGVSLVKVKVIKTLPNGKKVAITDGSTYGFLPDIIAYKWKYPVFVANKMNEPKNFIYNICGCLCDPIDILSEDEKTPELQNDDIIAIMDTGAYSNVVTSNFNTIPKAPILIINNQKVTIARRREKYYEMFMPELQQGYINKMKNNIKEHSL